tara:strand:- start:1711 stop:2862 length:1152 start_codon:yes stop_codon:yes gene_type:complete
MKAYLHIGIGKTGTSTIQKFLHTNRKALLKQKAWYPSSPAMASGRQIRLGAYALRDDLYTDPRKVLKFTLDELPAFRVEFAETLAKEISEIPAEVKTVIFSDEGLCSLNSPEEIGRIHDLLKPWFSSVDVIVYLRRQDMHSVSQHSQHLKAGRVGRKLLRSSHLYDFNAYLDLWARVFGEEHVIPRIFERSRFPKGDVLHDFLKVCGLKFSASFKRLGSLNESLRPDAEVFLMHLNQSVMKFDSNGVNPGRALILRHLLAEYSGKGMRPARAVAERFYADFAESNEAVRARWFADQKTLFDEDFSAYPEEGHDRSIATADLMAVTGSVINRLVAEYTTLREENRRLRGGEIDYAELALDAKDMLARAAAAQASDPAEVAEQDD